MRRLRRHAFTLIELLTVMAITAVLMTLIVVPVFQSFNLTRAAQAYADAQDKARQLAEKISREIGDAVSVRGGQNLVATTVNGKSAAVQGNSLVITVPQLNANGAVLTPRQDVEVVLPNVKIDLIQPAVEGLAGPNGGWIDPNTGLVDPTLHNPKGQPSLPIAPGTTMIRYWVGLRNPFAPYNNPYDGLLMAPSGGRDNLYVLYRIQVDPMQYRLIDLPGGGKANLYVTNVNYFDTVPTSEDPRSTLVGTDDATGVQVYSMPRLDDPRFFLPNVVGGQIVTTDLKAQRIKNFLGLTQDQGAQLTPAASQQNHAVVQTEVSRYDMILPAYDRASRRVAMVADANGTTVPNILPLIRFRPTQVSNEPAEGQVAVREGEEAANSASIAPDVFTTKLGLWSTSVVRTWPVGWKAGKVYEVGRFDPRNGVSGYPAGFSVYAYDPTSGLDDTLTGTELFDVDTYDQVKGAGRYPFTAAVNAANARSGWLSNATLRALFTPYSLDTAKGKIVASFGIDEVGDSTKQPPANDATNLPLAIGNPNGQTAIYAPGNDPNGTHNSGEAWYDPSESINERFNKAYNAWSQDTTNSQGLQQLDPSRIQRFIDLRVTPQGDGFQSPLDPTLGFKAAIVPGSEIVIGPDQIMGPNYGQPIRYIRVTSTPGPNQYRINYTDQVEPHNASGQVDYTQLGLTTAATSGFDPNTYNAKNFVSAMIQPQFKAGYIQLNSDANTPLPGDTNTSAGTMADNTSQFRVYYRFQFTRSLSGSSALTAQSNGQGTQDSFAVDYDSRQLMSVLLTVRNYPQSSLPNPQTVTLEATAAVRNYIR